MPTQPFATTAATTADCLPASVLRAVAAGDVQEPLLGVYLGHVAACDACCVRLDRETTSQRRFATAPQAAHVEPGPARPEEGWLGGWIERLKRATATETDSEDFEIGERVGPFRVTARLGEGASALVYEAVDEDLARPVVLKVLRPAHDDCPEQHRLMVSEARALASLQHDAIMPLLQLLWHDESPVLVFPRLPGETLADALASGRCTPRMTLAVVRDVATALAHTHERGIFHHDVKPSNIWLWRRGPGGQEPALLFDFGLTGGTTIPAGTPGYADPEITASSDPESRDLFSLGVVLHECLEHVAAAPAWVPDLVRRLTSADPAARPRAAQVVGEVDRLLARPRRMAWATAVAALAALGILGTVGFAAMRPAPPAAGGSVARSGPIRPDVVIQGGGFPVALAGDARTIAVVTDGPALRIRPLDDAAGDKTVPLEFKPDRLAFNEKGDRLAAADRAGNLAILDVASATITGTHRFEGGVAWLGWAGWNRDAVVVRSGEDVHAFFKTWNESPDASIPDWHLEFRRGGVRALATLPGTEGIISMSHDGKLTIWSAGNFTEDTPLRLLDYIRQPEAARVGWKSQGVCFVTEGRRVIEVAPYHGVRSFEAAAPVDALVWLGESQYAFMTGGTEGKRRLLLGDTARPDWSAELDLGGQTPTDLVVLADRRVAAITETGDVRIYTALQRP